MITGADQSPVAAPLIPSNVYIMLHTVLCNMICNMSLYLYRAENVLGHVPMMQCFVAGNSTQSMSLWQKHVTVAEAGQRHKERTSDTQRPGQW